MTLPTNTYSALADVSVAFGAPSPGGWSDSALTEALTTLAEIRRRVDAATALVAAEVAHRSRAELGYQGLAQRTGARTAENFVARVAATTATEARKIVRVGALLPASPTAKSEGAEWLSAIGSAVAGGRLSLEQADVVRAGLGAPDDAVSASSLAAAASSLLAEAATLTVEQLAARARELRNELDLAQVLDRERAMRDRRYLHVIPQRDGMTRLSGLLDPESAATVVAAIDAATSPRRGGPRFVDPDEVERAERLSLDDRTNEQIALDTVVELIRIASDTDPRALLGSRRPAVQLIVTERQLREGYGMGGRVGTPDSVSIEAIEREVCTVGTVPVLFDGDGQVVNVGREQRLFTTRQRTGLAARDGGCVAPQCDRPPSWCEAHHIDEWKQHGGRTDVAVGVLLCRHHHLMVHDNGWRIRREGAAYIFVPPRSLDPEQRPIPARSASPVVRRELARA